MPGVVAADLEADTALRGVQRECTRDRPADAVDLLVGDRRTLAQHLPGHVHEQVASRPVDLQTVSAVHEHPGVGRIAARLDDEVVLQLPLVAVVGDVDAWADVVREDACVRRDAGLPGLRAADVVVHHAGQARLALEARSARRAVDRKREFGTAASREQGHAGTASTDGDVVALSAADERRGAAELPWLEVERQRRECVERASLRSVGRCRVGRRRRRLEVSGRGRCETDEGQHRRDERGAGTDE